MSNRDEDEKTEGSPDDILNDCLPPLESTSSMRGHIEEKSEYTQMDVTLLPPILPLPNFQNRNHKHEPRPLDFGMYSRILSRNNNLPGTRVRGYMRIFPIKQRRKDVSGEDRIVIRKSKNELIRIGVLKKDE
jgi:hypothetical protein